MPQPFDAVVDRSERFDKTKAQHDPAGTDVLADGNAAAPFSPNAFAIEWLIANQRAC